MGRSISEWMNEWKNEDRLSSVFNSIYNHHFLVKLNWTDLEEEWKLFVSPLWSLGTKSQHSFSGSLYSKRLSISHPAPPWLKLHSQHCQIEETRQIDQTTATTLSGPWPSLDRRSLPLLQWWLQNYSNYPPHPLLLTLQIKREKFVGNVKHTQVVISFTHTATFQKFFVDIAQL